MEELLNGVVQWFNGSDPLFKNSAKSSMDVQIRLRVGCIRFTEGKKPI